MMISLNFLFLLFLLLLVVILFVVRLVSIERWIDSVRSQVFSATNLIQADIHFDSSLSWGKLSTVVDPPPDSIRKRRPGRR